MPQHRRTYSPERSRRRSRQVQESTIGTHVSRGGRAVQRDRTYAEGVARKANARRVLVVIAAAVVVVALAVGAGFLAFRGVVGSELALRDSDARDALVPAKEDEPTYVLVQAELGAVADPLDNGGPDLFVLARLDKQDARVTLVDLPSMLQVAVDNESKSLAEVANSGDAAVIAAVASFAKADVSHYVKLDEAGFVGMVDALGGVNMDVDQTIDDPQASDVYLPAGQQALDGEQALAYLRATNLRQGLEDQFAHQTAFTSAVIQQLFSREGSFTSRLDAVGPYLQTDCTLSDFEAAYAWMEGIQADSIACATAPGYVTEATDVTGSRSGRYMGSSADMAALLEAVDAGNNVEEINLDDTQAASPSSFVVEVQNGTTVAGAAGKVGELLSSKGFTVSGVGNAEQAVYSETLVIYKGVDGPSRAKAVVEALGFGRPVEGDVYYSFSSDVLVIIGGDFKPVN